MSWEQRNADFCNAQTDAQMAYIEAEREVDRLQTENAKLRELVRDLWEYIYIGTAQDGQSLHDRTRELGVSDHD